MRLEKKVSQKQLAHGLCSVSLLSYIEKGEKIPSVELRQRLLDRLGGSFQSYVNVFKGKEYFDQREKNQFVKLIKDEDWDALKEQKSVIEERIVESDVIAKQFYYDVLGLICFSERDYQGANSAYEKAVECTMAGIDRASLNQYLLAPIEYYYLVMRCYSKAKADVSKLEENTDCLLAILDKIERSDIVETKKCGIYSFALEQYYELVKDSEYFNILLLNNRVDRALEMLIKSNRSFNLMDLLKIKAFIFDGMAGADKEKEAYDNRIMALEEIYKIAEVKNNTECGVYFLYDEVSIDISDMIRKRRSLLGLTQSQLADGICSVKTLRRIEQGIVNSQYAVIEPLMQRLNLPGETQYDNYITDDWEVLRTAHELRMALRDRKYIQANYLLSYLEQYAEKNPQNEQMLKMDKAYLNYTMGNISPEVYLEQLDEALSITVQLNENTNIGEGYFTGMEVQCLFYMTMVTDTYKNIVLLDFFKELFDKNNCNNLGKESRAILLRWMSDRYEKIGDFLLSDRYARMSLQVDLENNKLRTAHKCLYDIVWNSVKSSNEKDMFSDDVCHKIFVCYVLSEFIKDNKSVEFMQHIINNIQERKNWMD
jgi:transcriptional regulator with XRE-family HTH domain